MHRLPLRQTLQRGICLLCGVVLLSALLGGGIYSVLSRRRRAAVPPPRASIVLTDLARDSDRVRLISAGGLAADAPKNTAPALLAARDAGFTQVLLFVRPSADGVLFVTEEAQSALIRSRSAKELRRMSVPQETNAGASGYHRLSLDDALRLCAAQGLSPIIEFETLRDKDLDDLIAALETLGLKKDSLVASYDGALLKRAVARHGDVRFCYSVTALSVDFALYLETAGIRTVMFSYNGGETAELAKSYLADGFTLICRDVNSIPVFEAMYTGGVRLFVTDRILYAL